MVKRKRTSYAGGMKVLDRTSAPSTYKVKNKKAVKVRVKKRVKVSPKLRSKIMNVIEKKVQHIKGYYNEQFIGGKMFCVNREQNVFSGCGVISELNGWHFTIPMFYHAANVLFNNQPEGYVNEDRYKLAVGGVNKFDANTLKLEVKNAYSVYQFKNNTQHVVTIKVVVGVPKAKSICQEASTTPNNPYGQNANGVSSVVSQGIRPVNLQWSEGLIDDTDNGWVINGMSPHNRTLTQAVIVQNASISDIGREPDQGKTFKNWYKTEVITLVLQPGQQVEHFVQGPKDTLLDFQKMYKSDIMCNVQKFSRNVCAIVYNAPNSVAHASLTGSLSGATPGRYADQIDTQDAGFVINVERKDHFTLKMPEQTGFIINGAEGAAKTLNLRVGRTIHNVFDIPVNGITTDLNTVDLSVMNPQQPVQAGPGTGT